MKKSIKFGTDGVRGNANKFPFTNEALKKLGNAIALWALKKYNMPSVLIASDTRLSCPRIKQEISKALLSKNIKVCNTGILPTPAVLQLLTTEDKFSFGIMISASHNQFEDNGIKIFAGKSGKISPEDEEAIEVFFEEDPETIEPKNKAVEWAEAKGQYINNITSHFQGTPLKGTTVVLDCANGATYEVAPQIFEKLGSIVHVINNQPNGKNINVDCGALHPKKLQLAVIEHNADIGFAFDGDGDRLITVSKDGEIKDGDDLLAILLEHPKLKNLDTVVGTVMTNCGFIDYLAHKNKTLLRTKVGDKYISARLEEENLLLGGETSGHIIIKNYLPSGDGIFAALMTLESIIANNNFTLETFEKYPQVLINVPVAKKEDLKLNPYAQIIQQHQQQMAGGRIIVRYSGTENLLRVMTEGPSMQITQSVADSLAKNLQDTLNQ